jgi:hypothetical protein
MRWTCAAFASCVGVAITSADVVTAPHARVEYKGVEKAYATALAETLSAAWDAYAGDFGFELPETVQFEATCEPRAATRLYTNGNDRLFLTIPDQAKLERPENSGTFQLYGVCHELGHIAMYRVLTQRDWMSGPAAEGWAHYAGSVVVDRVYEAKGEKLWPDPYDYRKDGTARLDTQLRKSAIDDVTRCAGEWRSLEKIIGRRGFAKLFMAWQAAAIDPERPGDALLTAATSAFPEKKSGLENWWTKAAPALVEKRERSATKAEVIDADKLSGRPLALAGDDGEMDGQKSIAGGGHARRFETPGGQWYLRSVSVFGARYGTPSPPEENFEIAMCDEDLKPIATWEKPYATFERGDLKWVRIELPPTRVPPRFCICLNFRPTASKGVYVAFDGSTKGQSLVGTPGRPGKAFDAGDWMIRVELDRAMEAEALETGKP